MVGDSYERVPCTDRSQSLTKKDLGEEAGNAEWGKGHVGFSLLGS